MGWGVRVRKRDVASRVLRGRRLAVGRVLRGRRGPVVEKETLKAACLIWSC